MDGADCGRILSDTITGHESIKFAWKKRKCKKSDKIYNAIRDISELRIRIFHEKSFESLETYRCKPMKFL